MEGLSMEQAILQIGEAARDAAERHLPVFIGGEHTVTLGAVRGLWGMHPDLAVLQLDAHLDLIDSYDERTVSHATVMRRVSDLIGFHSIVQLGVRSGTRAEYDISEKCLYSSSALALPNTVRRSLGRRPVYLTVDADVLDPSCAPGVGCPEPGGPQFRELQALLHSLRGLRVVAADVVEVVPTCDIGDITSVAAAKIVRELILLFTDRR